MTLSGQTVLTPAAKKQGVETVLPSIIHCVKGDGGRVEVEPIPRITEVTTPDQPQTLEIANVQDPETGVTRYVCLTWWCLQGGVYKVVLQGGVTWWCDQLVLDVESTVSIPCPI